MTTFRVVASPWTYGYVLEIPGVGVTQTHRDHPDDTPEVMAREYVHIKRNVPLDSFDVEIEYRDQRVQAAKEGDDR